MANKAEIIADRMNGMKYEDIAKKHGVSHQYVGIVCNGLLPNNFHYIKDTSCVFPNLRNWMNTNKVSKSELLRRMGLEPVPMTIDKMNSVMMRKQDLSKKWIDAMIKATGMTYECLFSLEERVADDGK